MDFEKYFKIGLALKALNGIFETIGGIFLLFVKPAGLNIFLKNIFSEELIEQPKDFIANFLINLTTRISPNVELYSAIYLLAHGLVKIFLVYALIKRKFWAYPTAIAVFGIFLIIQIYILIFKFSVYFFLLSVLDAIIIFLIWREYEHFKKTKNP